MQLNLFGATNTTGSFVFTGFATQQPGTSSINGIGTSSNSGIATSGSAFADFLLGLPQQTALQAPYQKSYLRENVWDLFAQDDWRVTRSFTILAGLRYEYFSPYSETTGRLAMLDTGNNFASVANVVAGGVGPFNGQYPGSLIKPDRNNISPRVGFAWRAHKDTVVRAGFGINYANGQYVKFVQELAFQPPFADVQTNQASGPGDHPCWLTEQQRPSVSRKTCFPHRRPSATTPSTKTSACPMYRSGTSMSSAPCRKAS